MFQFKIPFLKFCLLIVSFVFIYSCSLSDDEIIDEETPLINIYVEDTSFKSVGYLPSYRFYLVDQINFNQVTYVNLAFGNLNAAGNLVVGNGEQILPIVQKIKSTDTKVMLSIAGGGDTGDFWGKYLSAPYRKDCITRMVSFVIDHNLDGIDVDIEGSLITSLGVDYNLFVQDLKAQLHAKGKAITAALTPTYLDPVITDETLNNFDFINIMAYDATGPWRPNEPGQHSSYELAQSALNFWKGQRGIDSKKIVLGVPFYGRDFNPTELKAWTYHSIIEMNPEYAYLDQIDLIYYNGITTIVEKTKLAMKEANGIMVWELGQDSLTDLSLISAISQVINSEGCQPEEIKMFYKDLDGDGLGNLIYPYQACEAPVGYVDNKLDLDDLNPLI